MPREPGAACAGFFHTFPFRRCRCGAAAARGVVSFSGYWI